MQTSAWATTRYNVYLTLVQGNRVSVFGNYYTVSQGTHLYQSTVLNATTVALERIIWRWKTVRVACIVKK